MKKASEIEMKRKIEKFPTEWSPIDSVILDG